MTKPKDLVLLSTLTQYLGVELDELEALAKSLRLEPTRRGRSLWYPAEELVAAVRQGAAHER